MTQRVALDGRSLTPATLDAVGRGQVQLYLCDDARQRMSASARWLADHPADDVISSKWRWLSDAEPPTEQAARTRAFVRGHCAGVGDPLPAEVVRALIAARANVLATGQTGCRPEVADALLALLDHDVVPIVPCQGSVGAAGAAPLAHVAWVLCGWGGEAWVRGKRRAGPDALGGLSALVPNDKETLSLINGATLAAARAALTVHRAAQLLDTAEAAAALSFEVVRADLSCLSDEAHTLRQHPGAVRVASRLRELLGSSNLCTLGRRPDPFSIRCTPTVIGAARDTLDFVTGVVVRELNAACDNPLVIEGVGLVEAGNFHGAPVAMAMDHLKVALTQVASISERRTFRMTYGQLSGLPSFLLRSSGLNSGLMLAQYTAASLVSECKGLSHPASVDSLPTVQHREDHVSMGPIAADGAWRIAEALADVLAIELLCGAQGLDFHLAGEAIDEAGRVVEVPPSVPGDGSLRVWRSVRALVSRWDDDRVLHPDLAILGTAVRRGDFVV
ncbi:MAG: histidine ammonia-lyase [Myxococcota bacterium]